MGAQVSTTVVAVANQVRPSRRREPIVDLWLVWQVGVRRSWRGDRLISANHAVRCGP